MRHIGKRYVLGNRNAFNVLYLYQNQRSFITNTLNFMRRTTLRNLKLLSLSLFFILTAFIAGCSSDNTPPVSTEMQPGITNLDGPNSPSPLQKSVVQLVIADLGGVVGGLQTLGNFVTIAPGALLSNTYISVTALPYQRDVYFSPDMHFRKNVTITLSYKYFSYVSDYQVKKMKIYWYDPVKRQWVLFNATPIVDTVQKTFTFETNHFSRYAWGE